MVAADEAADRGAAAVASHGTVRGATHRAAGYRRGSVLPVAGAFAGGGAKRLSRATQRSFQGGGAGEPTDRSAFRDQPPGPIRVFAGHPLRECAEPSSGDRLRAPGNGREWRSDAGGAARIVYGPATLTASPQAIALTISNSSGS